MNFLRHSRYWVKSHIRFNESRCVTCRQSVLHAWRRALQKRVAGEEGFEPSHAGIKILCLNQLGDSPAEFSVYGIITDH